jgi:peptidoglycan/LPS O-acetylase OafA/YrhL
LAVVVHHIELLKKQVALPGLYDTSLKEFIGGLGKNGVYLFFVLSGFLITYLLLSELQKSNTIRIGYFYLRRIFRIWPLYYLIVLLCFFLLPFLLNLFPNFMGNIYFADRIYSLSHDFWVPLALFLVFLPNLALITQTPVAGAAQTWSVGVEEQFYLVWPLLLRTFRNHILWMLFAILIGKPLALIAMEFLGLKTHATWGTLYQFLESFKIELMALGGIGAWMLHRGYLENVLNRMVKWHLWILLLILAVALYFNIHYLAMGLLFLSLILLNTRDQSRIISNPKLSFLGDISYGLYMYHPIMMYLAFCTSRAILGTESIWAFNISFYLLTVGGTILISHLSFKYFETYFLRFKDKFVIVASGKRDV